ncbi:cupin domain-containing protein [soil metagenome]
MKIPTLLGGLTAAQFLRDYWQKKPLLISQALPDFTPLLSQTELFDLAARDDVESRLITHFNRSWKLKSGPFPSLPSNRKKAWTLLVQGVNLHDDAVDALMRRFRFLPNARLDDVMISYATDGGGVGPHFDSYDVFLLQASGKRRWRISAQKDLSLAEGMPLKILREFKHESEFVLEPGDMLYLPPHYAHEGVAMGECMTYSIGFRAPAFQQLGEAFLQFMSESIDLPGRYADAQLKPASHPAEIDSQMLSQVEGVLRKIEFTRNDVAVFLGEYLSEPKFNVFFEPPIAPISLEKFVKYAIKKGLVLATKSQMLYRGKNIFINGESFIAGKAEMPFLATFANDRRLAENQLSCASQDLRESFYEWYCNGWIKLP